MDKEKIIIKNAYENNLKNLNLEIPKGEITVVTGLSGAGKSSLVFDCIAAYSRRELNDTFPSYTQRYLPKFKRPKVGKIENLPVAIVINQKKPSSNERSTVGTYSDCYTLLRLLFSRIGEPFVGYSDSFSFNHPNGKCKTCDGLGELTRIDVKKLVNFDKSLNEEGVINYVAYAPGQWRWLYYGACGLFDNNKKIKDFSKEELDLFLYQEPMILENIPKDYYKNGKYEGLIYRMNRMLKRDDAKVHWKILEPLVIQEPCPDCKGLRLNQKILSCKIANKNISDISRLALTKILKWAKDISSPIAIDIKDALVSRLEAMIEIGLPYLTLDRAVNTLSGGEIQRLKIAKHNNTSLNDLLYILDEPSVGLHSKDINVLIKAIKNLKDKGNTVLMVEHQPRIIEIADNIIDLGPLPGAKGGEILFQGKFEDFMNSSSLTAEFLRNKKPIKQNPREPSSYFEIKNAKLNNLKNFDVKMPLNVLCCVVGVAGSGKSSLMKDFALKLDENVVYIDQKDIGASINSTPATYLGIASEIRKIFAKESKQKSGLFSFNAEGACEVCKGKGVIISEMAFMEDVESPCEACGGLRFNKKALEIKVKGLNIAQTLDLTIKEARAHFDDEKITQKLDGLIEVGLSYLHLNQALSSLSGGELQRMKLASNLNSKGKIFIIDEPSNGLHLSDIYELISLFDSMVEQGNSVFLVEHNLEIIKQSDYIVEIGPSAGDLGGNLLFAGKTNEILKAKNSLTSQFLK